MIIVAEQVFFSLGYTNTRMEDIARQAGCSKTTLYTYFESKENLYMAITYRAFQALLDNYYETLNNAHEKSGLGKVLDFFYSYITFSEKHYNYQLLLLEYMTFIRSVTGKGQEVKLTEPLKRSLWFKKVRGIHNQPLSIIVPIIKEGQEDGSITNNNQPEELFLTLFAILIGYAKLSNSSDSERRTFFNVNLETWKNKIRTLIKNILVV